LSTATAPPWDKEDIDTANRILQIILESAKLEAESANAAKSDFLARMSHELRTPMNAILGLVTILETVQKDPQQLKYLQTLRVSSNALLNVINDLLDISRIEAREFHLDIQPLSLVALAEEVLNLMRVQADAKHLRLTAELPTEDRLWCRGDPHRLKQIMTNLLSNAIKFTASGEVTLSLRRERGANNGANNTTDLFVISVRDTGIGIPSDKFESIFDRFTQADSGITRRYGGTGLGLAICKHLVSLMDGAIHVESTQGKGSTFTVSLPLPETAPDAMIDGMIPLPSAAATGTAGRILLVEDYEANIIVAVTLLQGMGYTVEVARTGREALELLAQKEYNAVLMDVQMPELDGYTATRRLRAKEIEQKLPHMPVIGMTAHALAGDREKCLESGMDDYLAKPFQATDLQQKLLWHLNHASTGEGTRHQPAPP
jgi:CheY-like chemotaxis protein